MKSLNQFIEEAANSVKKKEEEKIPKCPEGQYYDPKLKRCVIIPPKCGGRFWGGTLHKPNGNGHSNGNGNGSNGNGTPANGNGSNGHGNGGGNGSNGK